MEAFAGIGLLAALVVGIVLWGRAKDAIWRTVNQRVLFRGAHSRGHWATQSTLTFQTSQLPTEVVAAVTRTLNLPTGVQSAVLGRLYVAAAGDDGIVFESGSKLGRSFRSQLLVRSLPAGTTEGNYTVTHWTLSDGIVADVEQMAILERKIRVAVSAIDDSATFALA